MRILFVRVFSLLFLLQVTVPPVSAAEQLSLPAPDVEPPIIIFDETDTELEAGINTFTAAVTDNIGVASVTLYYKDATDLVFKTKTMKRSTTDPNKYTAELSLDPVISDKLEIYIRADDVSGNSIFEGQKFSPLTFTVVPEDTGEEVVRTVTEPVTPQDDEDSGLPTWAWVLIGLGVAGLASGGGGSSGDDPDPPATGTVTITTDVPD